VLAPWGGRGGVMVMVVMVALRSSLILWNGS